MKLIFATHNRGKIKEMRTILADLDFEILSAEEAGIAEDVVEDGKTFEENAVKKARFVAEKLNPPQSPFEKGGSEGGFWAVADDSGICIKALGGAPGVHSARWLCFHSGCGEEGRSKFTDVDLVEFTLKKMNDVPQAERRAYFECAAALAAPWGKHWVFEGRVWGRISEEPRGISRPKLPYDLIFIPDGHDRTFAEMPDEEKNKISHRAIAFHRLRKFFKEHFKERADKSP
jgi:XTP/dITP diphosphohydrolase